LRETASYESSCVKIGSVVFVVEYGKGREGKRRKDTKSHASVIFHLFVGKPPANKLSPNFAHYEITVYLSLCLPT